MADAPSSDLTDTDTTSLFNWVSDRLTMDNWGTGDFLKAGISLLTVSAVTGVSDIYQAIVGFVVNPLTSAGKSVASLFDGLVGQPATILIQTAEATATEIVATYTGWLGPLAFPVGVASVLAGLWLVNIYLSEQDTSDLFPGSFTDIDTPSWIPILPDPGVQEEGEDEDRD